LTNYPISQGVAKSFGLCFKQPESQLLSKLILDSNGLKDEDFRNVLVGISVLPDIKSIIYFNNEFGKKSLELLKPIISQRIMP